MAEAGDEFEKHFEEPTTDFLEDICDCSPLTDYGCLTIAQCAVIAAQMLLSGEIRDQHLQVTAHYYGLAQLDVKAGWLDPRHPLTRIPYSEYERMIEAGMFGTDGVAGPVLSSRWLIPLNEAERWLKSKDIHFNKDINFDFVALRARVGGGISESEPALASTIENMATLASDINNWQSQARAIADECFDTDTRSSCRDSLKGYSYRVMEEMQKRGIKGPQGIIQNPKTIMREALQANKWWGHKQK